MVIEVQESVASRFFPIFIFFLPSMVNFVLLQETLDTITDIELVVNLKLREDVLIMKCLGRRVCSGCGTNYNVAEIDVATEDGGRIFMPPLLPPPACASKMTIRADDTEEVVRARMDVYAQEVRCREISNV